MTIPPSTTSPGSLSLSEHCRERFRDRLRPSLEREASDAELARLVSHASVRPEPPAWLEERQRVANPADLYLLLCDEEIVIPLRRDDGRFPRFIALTCLTKTGISELAREKRNDRARGERRRRRTRREVGHRREGRRRR